MGGPSYPPRGNETGPTRPHRRSQIFAVRTVTVRRRQRRHPPGIVRRRGGHEGRRVKKRFVAGPFDNPPFENFRANPLMAAVKKNKVRPIMNLSSPKGSSFNDALDETEINLLGMSSAKLFGEAVRKMGKGAVFSKQDIQDAYKLIPNPKEQWQFYGFEWLGKFFYDTTTVFGSKAAPASFDPLPETIVNIVCTLGKIPKNLVHRQLDDIPMVSPEGSRLTERFTKLYQEICKSVNVPLAPFCDKHEKAFSPTTFGTVLGINFDSVQMTWVTFGGKRSGYTSYS
jgi:hypothetical protein